MESIIESGKAFGLIEPINSSSNTNGLSRIKVLGIFDNGPRILTEPEIKRVFTPSGYVYGGEFIKLHEVTDLSELVQFSFSPVPEKKYSNWDDFKVSSKVRKFGSRLLLLQNYKNNQKNIDLSDVSLGEDIDKSNFYALAQDRFILGKLSAKNGQLTCQNKFVKKWDIDSEHVVRYNGVHYLLTENPNGESTTLDCSNNRQLVDWFRDNLKALKPVWVEELDQKTSWRKDLSTIFSQDEDNYLRQNRLEKVMKFIDDWKADSDEIIRLLELSDRFKQWYETRIDEHKNSFLERRDVRVSEMEKEFMSRKNDLDIEISKVRRQLKENLQQLSKVDEQIKRGQRDVEHLTKEKERLLADFSILDNIMNRRGINHREEIRKGYLIEEVIPESFVVLSKLDLIKRMKYFLSKGNLNPQVAGLAIDTFLLHKAIFVKDIMMTKCFVNSFGKVKYIIQQAEVDWLHFSDFWKNGLEEIWISAHQNPDYLHVLILQDVNLASPECYSRPLLDMISRFREKIPFDGTSYPKNLRVIASKASVTSPRIGLPLLRNTFNGWGQIGFDKDITSSEVNLVVESIKEGFVDVTRIEEYYPDDIERIAIMKENSKMLPELYDQFN
jgi:hypothetical protein